MHSVGICIYIGHKKRSVVDVCMGIGHKICSAIGVCVGIGHRKHSAVGVCNGIGHKKRSAVGVLMGWGMYCRQDSHLLADRFLMVFDMRVMRAMAPIQVSLDPTFLRFIPALSNHLVVVSQVGRPIAVPAGHFIIFIIFIIYNVTLYS